MHTLSTAPPLPSPRLPVLIRDPQAVLHHLEQLVRTWSPPLLAALAFGAVTYTAAWLVLRARRGRAFAADARVVEVCAPPEAAPSGGEALWANLLALHRPRLARLRHGQPHLGFEYRAGADGLSIRVWIPKAVPPGLVEHAVQAAWPGARALPLQEPAPPLPHTAAQATGGRLVPARTSAIPLKTKHEADPLRALFGAVSELQPGETACVQILARPASPRRARKLRATLNALLGKPTGATGLKTAFFDAITPHTGTRPKPAASTQAWRDPRTDADARAAAAKLAGPLWEVQIRYGVAVPASPDAHGRARGLAHAVAGSFNIYADRNHLRRTRLRHPAAALERRVIGRGMLLSVPELASFAHLPADLVVPGLSRAGARPVPPSVRIPQATTGRTVKVLGDADAGPRRAVALPVPDARHHLHVIGKTGSGKSTLMANLILADVEHGRGAVVIDPNGDLIADLLDRLPVEIAGKTVLVDPEDAADPPRINMFDGAAADVAVDNLVGIFKRIYTGFWGPRTDDLLRATCLTLLSTRTGHETPTLADIPTLLTSAPARRRAVAALPEEGNQTLRTFWAWWESMSEPSRAHTAGPLLNKLRAFLLRDFVARTVAQGATTLDLGAVLDGGLALIRLPKGVLGDETVRLLGSFVVAKTWQAASSRAKLGRPRLDASLYMDEAHNFLTLPYSLEEMLAEARHYHLSLVLAHQNLAQLPADLREGISANARNKVFFTVSPEDAHLLERHTLPHLGAHDLSHLDAFQAAAALVVDAADQPACTLTTRPLSDPVPGRAEQIRTAARRNAVGPASVPAPGQPGGAASAA